VHAPKLLSSLYENGNLIVVASPNGTSGISHVTRGTIAAIVIAAGLGSIVFLIALFSLWRRRRQFGRILHRRRIFVPPTGNNHSKVLEIVRGPDLDEFDDMYDDKDKTSPVVGDGSGSLSFTLDLPIQSRHSLPTSRQYSGNSAQELPRSPTISLGRPGTHARSSSRGVPLQEMFAEDAADSGEFLRPPSSDVQGQRTSERARPSIPRDQEMHEQAEGRTIELTPPGSPVPLPQPIVTAADSAARAGSDRAFSFLDITASSRTSSFQRTGRRPSSSSSNSESMRRSDQRISLTRRISLPFALGYHRDPPTGLRDVDLSGLMLANVEFPRFTSNIRPLPRIPQTAVVHGPDPSEPPLTARATVRPHTQSGPPLHVATQFDEPQRFPRSVSVTPAPPTSSIQSGSNVVPHIVIHSSSFQRSHPRVSSIVSPTESVPVTVSDIHFRHSSDDERGEPESRRTSELVIEHPSPHPPLPQRSYTSPFIMQKLFGIPVPPPQSPDVQASLESPGAGPSKPRDRDPSPPDSPSAPGSGRLSS
jgi:hypothetical protein